MEVEREKPTTKEVKEEVKKIVKEEKENKEERMLQKVYSEKSGIQGSYGQGCSMVKLIIYICNNNQ